MGHNSEIRCAITGTSGFVAPYVIEELAHNSLGISEILCIDLELPSHSEKTSIPATYVLLDMMDRTALESTLRDFQPDYIIHLASLSSVAESWKKPSLSFLNNLNIFLNVLESMSKIEKRCRILSVGSSEQYGVVTSSDIPIRETTPQNPQSPYAVARVSQEMLSRLFVDNFGLDIILTRSFNHVGPRQLSKFAIPSFIEQIVRQIRSNSSAITIATGNLDIIRDFLDVRDVAKAYVALLKKGKTGHIYNVCSGSGYTLSQIVSFISEIIGRPVQVTHNPDLVRPADNPVIIGDCTKLRTETGWIPSITLKETLKAMIDYTSQHLT
jgi:GDP-4-dehydro-6-deoxy-D-mannose reductase